MNGVEGPSTPFIYRHEYLWLDMHISGVNSKQPSVESVEINLLLKKFHVYT